MATIPQLTVLSNLETLNAHYIKEGMSPKKRLELLKAEAVTQLKSLIEHSIPHSILSPYVERETPTDFDKNLKGFLAVPLKKNE